VITGFRSEVAENRAILGYYAASSRNFLTKFRGKLLVPSSGVKKWNLDSSTQRMGPICCPEMSVRNYHYSLH